MAARNQNTQPYRYHIAHLLEDLTVGSTFDKSIMHVTVLPWFNLESNEQNFTEWFYRHFDKNAAFDVMAGQRAMFGPDQDVPVTILEPQAKFMQLHKLALSWFGDLGARWADLDPYVGDDYIPHIAQRHGYSVEPGQVFHVASLALFKTNHQEYHSRTVVARAKFYEEN